MPDMEDGDLIVIVNIKKHSVFKRKGADLFIAKEITLLESLTGVNYTLTHLDGRKVTITSDPG